MARQGRHIRIAWLACVLAAVIVAAASGPVTDRPSDSAAAGAPGSASIDSPTIRRSSRGARARSAVVDKRTGCVKPAIVGAPPRLVAPRFPLVDVNRPNPICRLAQRRTIDVPLSGDRGARGFDPRPRCGNYDAVARCFPSAFRQGNARIHRDRLAPPVVASEPLIALYDSFGPLGGSPRSSGAFAFIEQGPYPGCFNVYDRLRRPRGSTDPRSPARCDPANAGRGLATIEFQGRGCMATRTLERRHVIAGIVQAPGREPALNTGLRGFVELEAVPVAPGVNRFKGVVPFATTPVRGGLRSADFAMLQAAYPGCGRKGRPRMRALPASELGPADTQLHAADDVALSPIRQPDGSQAWPNPGFPAPDQYLNATSLRNGCDAQSASTAVPGCTGFYANYQGPCYAADLAAVALSTTYVSGANTTRRDNPGNVRSGGIARAFVPRDGGPGSFQPVDKMLYADNNVPAAQGSLVTWVFGNFNPLAATTNASSGAVGSNREQGIWGWTAIRRPRAGVGNYTC